MNAASHGPAAGLARLRVMAADGRLDELCDRRGVAVLTVSPSTARGVSEPRDLDIAVLHRPGRAVDYPGVIGDLQIAAAGDIDPAVLDGAGPVLRERALVAGSPT